MTGDNSIESALNDSDEQDVNTEADASTASTEDDNTAADASTAENVDENTTSEPSSDDGDKNEEQEDTLEDMIAKSIDEVTAEAPAEGSPSEEQSDQDNEGDEESSDTESKEQEGSEDEGTSDEDVESEEEKSASDEWRNHPATKKILSERKKARAERDELRTQIQGLEQEASQFRQIKDYLDEGGVSDQDAAMALQLVRLWYENPNAMFEQLERMRGELGSQLGLILPEDLQREVDQGLISPERASELAKARGSVQIANQQAERVTQQSQQQTQQAEVEYRTQLFQNWATQVSNTDPDLTKKLPLIVAKMSHYLATEGDPGSPQAAWDRLNKAHQEVTSEIKGFIPAKPATQKSPRSTGPKMKQAVAPQNFDQALDQEIDKAMGAGGG